MLAADLLRLVRPLGLRPRWLVWLRDTPTLLQRLKGDRQESRVWGFILKRSMRYPAIAAVALDRAF